MWKQYAIMVCVYCNIDECCDVIQKDPAAGKMVDVILCSIFSYLLSSWLQVE